MSASDLADQARQTASQAQQVASDLADQVKHEAATRLTGQIDQAATALGGASNALRSVSGQLRQEQQPLLAGYAEQAATKVEGASTYLKGKDLDRIVDDVEQFARRKPAMFLGAAFAVGMAAARLLKSPVRSESSGTRARAGSVPMGSATLSRFDQAPGAGTQPGMMVPSTGDRSPSEPPRSAAAWQDTAPDPRGSTAPQPQLTPRTTTPEFGRAAEDPWINPGTAA